ncbi:MAG: DUF192 domain-containing protein [Elusimicrobiaceae bacterium]|nr:DUF192 domain-containing protein [Elusimicrobiaceae bacterium]
MKRLFVFLAGVLFFCACAYQQTNVTLPDGFVIRARIADTPQKTEKGLMFVKNLPADEGMLFVFDADELHHFWMKNTLIDLDIIFLSPGGVITQLYEKVPHTYTYTPDSEVPVVNGQAQYVLEAAAGTITRHQLKSGDKINFNLP